MLRSHFKRSNPSPISSIRVNSISRAGIIYTSEEVRANDTSTLMKGIWQSPDSQSGVALKIFHENAYPLFEDELKIHSKLNQYPEHPQLTIVYGKINTVNQKILVMEFPQGSLLTSWLQKTPRNNEHTVNQGYEIALDLLNGLQYLHSLSIVHMNINPDSIILDTRFKPKLMDFELSLEIPQGADSVETQKIGGIEMFYPYEKWVKKKNSDQYEVSLGTDIFSLAMVIVLLVSNQGHDFPCLRQISNLYGILFLMSRNRFLELPNTLPANTKSLIIRSLQFDQFNRPCASEAYAILDADNPNNLRSKRFT